jgi:hypothetical protein
MMSDTGQEPKRVLAGSIAWERAILLEEKGKPDMPRPRKEPQSFDLNNVIALLGRQLHGAMAATNVPISLNLLAELLHEIDRLRSRLDAQEEEANKDKIIPLVPKPEDERP